eukprot:NODE_1511_length_1390_cov_5.912006_g1256_i0.p1 GENE.NODE_1511_length_1390_cov_5.912006_g1256_i0~~NODE_1511_length_1390_cov_5.912006_g1256_i0.p1  ORF type:complete len:366 (+),score=42.35 NODE_1511_length_1390_cov_5.912006_g1256_i0:263-1360(+)
MRILETAAHALKSDEMYADWREQKLSNFLLVLLSNFPAQNALIVVGTRSLRVCAQWFGRDVAAEFAKTEAFPEAEALAKVEKIKRLVAKLLHTLITLIVGNPTHGELHVEVLTALHHIISAQSADHRWTLLQNDGSGKGINLLEAFAIALETCSHRRSCLLFIAGALDYLCSLDLSNKLLLGLGAQKQVFAALSSLYELYELRVKDSGPPSADVRKILHGIVRYHGIIFAMFCQPRLSQNTTEHSIEQWKAMISITSRASKHLSGVKLSLPIRGLLCGLTHTLWAPEFAEDLVGLLLQLLSRFPASEWAAASESDKILHASLAAFASAVLQHYPQVSQDIVVAAAGHFQTLRSELSSSELSVVFV